MIVIQRITSWIVLSILVPFGSGSSFRLTLLHTKYLSSTPPRPRITDGIPRPHFNYLESANVTTLPIMSDQVIRPSVETQLKTDRISLKSKPDEHKWKFLVNHNDHEPKVDLKHTINERSLSVLNKYPDKGPKSYHIKITGEIPAPSEYKESVLESPPAAIDQQQYFQDTVMSINRPYFYEFGHIFEKLYSGWEERFERLNLKDHRYQGKVKWGSKESGHGQHYYDLNYHK